MQDIRLPSADMERILWAVYKAGGLLKINKPEDLEALGLDSRPYNRAAEWLEANGFISDRTNEYWGRTSNTKYRVVELLMTGDAYCRLHEARLKESYDN